MKFKNTLLSLLRHGLTMAGGALAISPDPKMQALGIVLAALGSGWGAKDEHSAENPGAKPGAGVLPLIAFALIGALASVTVTGCVNTPGTSQLDPVRTEANATRLAKVASLAVLTSEPAASSELARVADRIDLVLNRGTLTPEQIGAFLDALKIEERNRLLVAGLVTELTGIFTELTGQTIPDLTHPLATATLRGVQRGIRDALALQAAVQPTPRTTQINVPTESGHSTAILYFDGTTFDGTTHVPSFSHVSDDAFSAK